MKVCNALATVMTGLACFDLLMVMVCMQVEQLRPAAGSFILGGAGCALAGIFFDAMGEPTDGD